MDLSAMRTAFGDYMFDDAGLYTSAMRDRYINTAMRYVCNWADGMDQALFVTTATYTVTAADQFHSVPLYTTGFAISPTGAFRFRRCIKIQRTDFNTSEIKELQAVRMEDADKYKNNLAASGVALPAYFIQGENVVFVHPVNAIDTKMTYVYDVPNMVNVDDTPGTTGRTTPGSGGSGIDNSLPTEYHALIPIYAAALALQGEASPDAPAMMAIYGEQRQQLEATLRKRRGNTGGP